MIQTLKAMHWQFITVVYTSDSIGQGRFDAFVNELENSEFCIALAVEVETMSTNDDIYQVTRFAKLAKRWILSGYAVVLRMLLYVVRGKRIRTKLTFQVEKQPTKCRFSTSKTDEQIKYFLNCHV